MPDDTHRADLQSWVESAHALDTDFPLQNLPLGLFQSPEQSPRPGIAIGAEILNLASAAEQGFLDDTLAATVLSCRDDASLNALIALGAANAAHAAHCGQHPAARRLEAG